VVSHDSHRRSVRPARGLPPPRRSVPISSRSSGRRWHANRTRKLKPALCLITPPITPQSPPQCPPQCPPNSPHNHPTITPQSPSNYPVRVRRGASSVPRCGRRVSSTPPSLYAARSSWCWVSSPPSPPPSDVVIPRFLNYVRFHKITRRVVVPLYLYHIYRMYTTHTPRQLSLSLPLPSPPLAKAGCGCLAQRSSGYPTAPQGSVAASVSSAALSVS